MNNAIFFYKLPYVYGGVTQPYFMSDAARDGWFNKYSATQVNGTGVSIKFGYNYELEVVVDVDYTQISDFNFAVIRYNNKNFYANIIDSELVSVNKSRVSLMRNPLFECTNYLKYFESFKISKSTINNFENYTRNSSFFINEKIRYSYNPEHVPILNQARKDCILRPFIILYLDPTIPLNFPLGGKISRYAPYGVVQNFIIGVIPIFDLVSRKMVFRNSVEGFAYTYEFVKNMGELLNHFLNKYSAYIIKYEVISIPCAADEIVALADLFPYSAVYSLSDSDSLPMMLINDQTVPRFDIFFYNSSIFEKNYFYFFDRSNEIEISSKEVNGSGYVSFEYSLSSETSSVTCFVTSNLSPESADTIFGSYQKIYTFQFNYDVPFIVTAESTFKSENRYYNALTTNAISQKGTSGLIQSLSQFGAGASELSSPRMLKTSMTTGSLSLGLGNIIRGIASLADTANDISHFKNERNLLAQQEIASPRTSEKGGDFFAQYSQLNFTIERIIMKPFESDLASIKSEFEIYGGNCYTEEDNFNWDLHTVNGYFYLAAIAVLKHPSTLTARQYSELYKILRDGCRYEIISE